MRRKGQIIVGLALILIFILMALAAPVLAPNDPNATNLALKNAPPSAEYPLGCDQMGRCELSRLLYGARYSMGLTIPVLIVLAAFALFVGCYSSYTGAGTFIITVMWTLPNLPIRICCVLSKIWIIL